MRFQHRVIHDFEDATRNFEQLESLLSSGPTDVARTSALSNLGIARGTVTVTWPGGTPISDTISIAHGLGASPSSTSGSPSDLSDANTTASLRVICRNGNPSQVVLIAGYSPAGTVTCTFNWICVL